MQSPSQSAGTPCSQVQPDLDYPCGRNEAVRAMHLLASRADLSHIRVTDGRNSGWYGRPCKRHCLTLRSTSMYVSASPTSKLGTSFGMQSTLAHRSETLLGTPRCMGCALICWTRVSRPGSSLHPSTDTHVTETEWERWLSRLPSVNNMTAQYIVSKTTMRGLLSASTEELAGLLPELPQRCLDHLVMILHTKVSGYVGGLPPNLQTSRALHPPRHTFGTISYGTHYSDHASTEEDGSMVDEIQHKTAHGPGDAPSHRHDLVGVTYTTPAQGRHSTKHTSMSNRTVAPPDSGMREARRRTSPRSTPEARTPSTASSTSIASHLVFHESAGAEFHRLRGRRLAFKGTTGQTRLKWT